MRREPPIPDRDGLFKNGSNEKIVLHACCAPCSGPVIPRIASFGRVTVFYSNSNIHPHEEYLRRRDELAAYCARQQVPFVEDEYDPEAWLEAVKGLECEPEKGRRCEVCFRFRLKRSATWAKDHGMALFTTTLTISPHKNSPLLLGLGRQIGEETGVGFLARDFKKRDGYRESLRISHEEGFYRQNYCGCRFSAG
ncbi:MAG: epoxyqueuosine reductase QueH [Peptococcaceae bacterium]|nr:epoxyqueuosine reductase QueH [Peptococcaceae bacterium]